MSKKKVVISVFLSLAIILTLFFSGGSTVKADTSSLGVAYEGHVQNIGWQPWVSNGEDAGTHGQSLRLEALKINLVNAPAGAKIDYQAHVQNIGWQSWVNNGQEAGTHGSSLRVEAIKISLENLPNYSVQYRAHVQNIGWQPWVVDGAEAGTTGQALRMEAIEIKIVPKNAKTNNQQNNISQLAQKIKEIYPQIIDPGTAQDSTQNNNDKINAIAEKVNTVLSTIITPNMSQLDKELAIHDYIVANTYYDMEGVENNNIPEDDYNPYGVLINGKAVCQGYAETFSLLSILEGIPVQIVDDYKINHAWNVVRLDDGNYYQVDTTWDDPVASVTNSDSNYLNHSHFNLSDKQMFSDHFIDTTIWSVMNYPKAKIDSKVFYSNIYVNAAPNGDWIYTNNEGKLYAVNSAGNNSLLSQDNARHIQYYNGWIYYINDSDGSTLYRIDTSGNNRQKLGQDQIYTLRLYGNSIYYVDVSDWNIYKINLDAGSLKQSKIANTAYTNYSIDNGYLYYNYWNGSTSEMYLNKLDLSNLTGISILKAGINVIDIQDIQNNYIYYKIDNNLYRMTSTGGTPQLLVQNVDSQVEIFNNWIYYKSTQDEKWYKIKVNGTSVVKLTL